MARATELYNFTQCSKELKICGLLGPGISLNRKNASVADTVSVCVPVGGGVNQYCHFVRSFVRSQEIGVGGTSSWRVCGLNPISSLAIVFEVANQVCVCVHMSLTMFMSCIATCCCYTASQCHPPRPAWCCPVHHFLPALLWTEESACHNSGQAVSQHSI